MTGFLLNYPLDVLNVSELSQALAELYAEWFYFIWTVYWANRFLLNFLLLVLHESCWIVTSCRWIVYRVIYYIWPVYWVTTFLLNCIEYFECCWTVIGSSWTVYRMIFLYVNCLNSWVTRFLQNCLLIVFTLGCCWTVTGSCWTVCRMIFLYLNCPLDD